MAFDGHQHDDFSWSLRKVTHLSAAAWYHTVSNVLITLIQRVHDIYTTLHQRRCNVMTLHRRVDVSLSQCFVSVEMY